MPTQTVWSRQILWGNHRLTGGVITPTANAWATNSHLGHGEDAWADGDNVVRGTRHQATTSSGARSSGDNVVRGIAYGDNVVWGTSYGDNVVWGTSFKGDNVVWGTASSGDNVVWGTDCGGADCDTVGVGHGLRRRQRRVGHGHRRRQRRVGHVARRQRGLGHVSRQRRRRDLGQ